MAEEVGSTRESLAWNPGRETVHADEKTGEREVFLEPLLWGLFSLGGFITAFLFLITVFLLFVAPVFGLWPTDPAAYATFAAHWQEPLVRLFFFALIGGSLFHGTHRLKFMLVDAGLRGPGIEAALDIILNAIAIVGTLGALYYAVRGWLFVCPALFSAVLSWREPSSRVLWLSSQALLRPPSPPVAELAPPSGSACRRNPSPGPGRAPSFRLLVPDPRARPRRVRSATPPRSAPSWSKAPGFGRCLRSRFHPR